MITILRDPEIADKLVYVMKDDGRRVGGITSVLTDDGDLMITALDSEVELYYDGLVRAVLAYAMTRGIDRAIFSIDDERQLRRLKGFGFITDESKVLESISGFFSKGCASENN